MLLSDFVKMHRMQSELTQNELAEAANLSLRTVQRFEAKKAYNPQGKTAMHLCKALGTTLSDMLDCELQ